MTLLEQWQNYAYDEQQKANNLNRFWSDYFLKEKGVYEQLLSDKDTVVTGTVKELADKYNLDLLTMVGFLDGINDSLKTPNPIDTMEEDTCVSLEYDPEKLYRNMIEAKADWLYGLDEWKNFYSEEELKAMYKDQKKSHTIVNTNKVGRNDPCPCGSGKKYKFCCGKKN